MSRAAEILSLNAADHSRWIRFVLLSVGMFLCGCQTARTRVSFENYELVMGSSKHQTVLTGFFFDGGVMADLVMADLAVVRIDDKGQRQLRFYAINDASGAPKFEVTLRPSVQFVDTANIGGRDRLITYERGRLSWFDPKSRTNRSLVKVTSNFQPPRRDEIPHVDITHDVNGDDLEDLLVPCSDGFQLIVQKSNGTFAVPVVIGCSFDMNNVFLTEGYRYDPWSQGRIHAADYNHDGRQDLVYWNRDHFEVHIQNRDRLFARMPKSFTTEVAFDSDDLSTLAAPQGVRDRRKDHQPAGAMTGRVLHAVTDLNGDGIADLGVFALKGGSPWKMHASYEVHLGAPTTEGGTVFAAEVGAAIHLEWHSV